MSYTFYRMANKNKQYKIEKGLLLFTQPRSPYFYGKIRLKGKYLTKSFSPISDFNTAKEKLYEWKKELTSKSDNFSTNEVMDRNQYTEFKELDNKFQFLDVGRFDPDKLTPDNRKIHFIEIQKKLFNIIKNKEFIKYKKYYCYFICKRRCRKIYYCIKFSSSIIKSRT